MPGGDVPVAVVIGLVTSLVMEAVKQYAPPWFTGAAVSLATFVLTILVSLGWYWIGGIPDAASWQDAIRTSVLAFAAGQTFYGTARKVGLQQGGAVDIRPPVTEAGAGSGERETGGPDPNPNGRTKEPAPPSSPRPLPPPNVTSMP